MAQEVSSISRVGTTEPFELQVSRGQVAFHKTQFKFGFNPDIDDSLETVWTEGGLYSYLTSATVLKISSSSANDTSAGTGARTITISGLDANYDEISESVTLNGQTAVNTTQSFLRVFRMIVDTAGSGGQNAGVIYAGTGTVTSGVPANKYGTIAVGDNQSLMCFWTVPRGYNAYLHQVDISMNTEVANKYGTVSLVARPEGRVFNVKDKFALSQDIIHQEFKHPIKFSEKTDLEVRAIASSSNANLAVSAAMDFIYIEKRPFPA
jgi:hypothetical protein